MNLRAVFTPTHRTSSPILMDEPVINVEGATTTLFYNPGAQLIAQHLGLIIAGSAGTCLLAALILSRTGGPEPLEHLCTFLAFVIAGLPALAAVREKVARLRIDIDVLMLLGAGLAAYVGNPFEGALLLFLFALSGGLEAYALRRTQRAIVALRDLSPTEATLIEGKTLNRVPLRQVPIGALLLVKPGEKVPLDGTVLRGGSSVDESAITGESMPRDCNVGDSVFAGTQNLNGRLEVRVTKLASDTTLAKIVELVTSARQRPTKAQRLIDRIGPVYSIAVVVGAVLVGLVAALAFGVERNEAVLRGIAVLIVASPCALIIATPVAYLSAIAAAARRGVLIKGGSHLETVAQAAVVIFDKTGTLTTGRVRLTDVEIDGEIDEAEILRLVGAIEGSSNHPLAMAVNRALTDRSLTAYAVTDYQATPGQGASGTIDGRAVWVGRPALLPTQAPRRELGRLVERTEALRRAGKTVSAVVVDGTVALLAFEDTLRPGAIECIQRLRSQGLKRIEMLTGDHEIVAARVAGELKLDGCLAELAPDGKVAAMQKMRSQYGRVLLVGDAINDAPALAHADVGIAMGSIGADVALEAADVVLMQDRIETVAWLHRHACRTAGIVKQNLTFAIGVIAVLSVFAAVGAVPLPLAVIGHEGSTVLVALNALRLLHTSENV